LQLIDHDAADRTGRADDGKSFVHGIDCGLKELEQPNIPDSGRSER
jgi:hypothetical protein